MKHLWKLFKNFLKALLKFIWKLITLPVKIILEILEGL
jgi:hypothetical protein